MQGKGAPGRTVNSRLTREPVPAKTASPRAAPSGPSRSAISAPLRRAMRQIRPGEAV
jgi:hypothetical protein